MNNWELQNKAAGLLKVAMVRLQLDHLLTIEEVDSVNENIDNVLDVLAEIYDNILEED